MRNDKKDGQLNSCLKEEDFYPPSDNRCLKSYIRDVNGGDSFAEYCEYIYEILDEEEYYE